MKLDYGTVLTFAVWVVSVMTMSWNCHNHRDSRLILITIMKLISLLRPGIAPNLYRQVWAQCWAPLWACYKDLNCRSPMILLDLMADNPNWIKQDKGAWDWFKIFDIIPSEPGHRRTVITSYFLFYIKTRSRLAAYSHIQFLWCSHQQILSGKVIRPECRRVILPPTPWWTLSMVSILQPD